MVNLSGCSVVVLDAEAKKRRVSNGQSIYLSINPSKYGLEEEDADCNISSDHMQWSREGVK